MAGPSSQRSSPLSSQPPSPFSSQQPSPRSRLMDFPFKNVVEKITHRTPSSPMCKKIGKRGEYGQWFQGKIKHQGKEIEVLVSKIKGDKGFKNTAEWAQELQRQAYLLDGFAMDYLIMKPIGYCMRGLKEDNKLRTFIVFGDPGIVTTMDECLHRFSKKERRAMIPWKTRLRILEHTARALAELHSKMIYFRCFRSTLIFLDEEGQSYIPACNMSKFGLPYMMDEDLTTASLNAYFPDDDGMVEHCSVPSNPDISLPARNKYQYGIFMFETLTGKRPVASDSGLDNFSHVKAMHQISDDNLADDSLKTEEDYSGDIFIHLASLALEILRNSRPDMNMNNIAAEIANIRM